MRTIFLGLVACATISVGMPAKADNLILNYLNEQIQTAKANGKVLTEEDNQKFKSIEDYPEQLDTIPEKDYREFPTTDPKRPELAAVTGMYDFRLRSEAGREQTRAETQQAVVKGGPDIFKQLAFAQFSIFLDQVVDPSTKELRVTSEAIVMYHYVTLQFQCIDDMMDQ